MKRLSIALPVTVAALLAAPVASAITLEEVVSKHVAAHGGAAAWADVKTMKITGDFRAFSVTKPFTLVRKREDLFYMDHVWNGHRVQLGHDGKTYWSDNEMDEQGPVPLQGPDLTVLRGELPFGTPLIGYPKNGYQANLVGPTEIEGQAAIAVELTRPDGEKETWYLDPTTYLEIRRDSPGSDFGQPMPQTTYFDDFRKESQIVIPHYVETQWYTRDRAMTIRKVEINVPVEDALFRMPPPPGMSPVLPMAGTFDVATSQRNSPRAEWTEGKRSSTVEPMMGDAMIEERFTDDGHDVVRTLSYDRFRKKYRMTEFSSESRTMDVEEGEMADGKITLSNESTGTTLVMFGTTIHTRTVIHDITADGFQIDRDVSTDGGKEWFTAAKAVYTRTAK